MDTISNITPAESFEMRSIEQLKGYAFFVDSYQRGYKWDAQQVIDLLQDINEFSPDKGGIYPLQPIITKLRDPEAEPHKTQYELIDGQQRMSTIYLILQSTTDLQGYYRISYATRESSRIFLEQIHTVPVITIPVTDFSKVEAIQSAIGKFWQDYIVANPHFDNPDNYHFYIAWQVVNHWFRTHDKRVFCNKLLAYTQVLWYQVADTAISEQVFININSGKVALTCSELIKALFLLACKDESNREISDLRQSEIATEWDVIERALQNDELWYFIYKAKQKNRKAGMPATRIDLLFDLITGKRDKDDTFFSYRHYDMKWRQERKLQWQPVKELFQKLQEWFEDRELYHYIGFLVFTELATIADIVTWSTGKQKDAFKRTLIGKISEELSAKKDNDNDVYSLDELRYDQTPDEIHTVLLLFNVETYLRSDPNYRFPFDRLNTKEWSLEHIHPQNPAAFETCEELRVWAEDSLHLLEDVKAPGVENAIARLEELKSIPENGTIPVRIKKLAEQVAEEVSEQLDTHALPNLALLDRVTNSRLSNRPFGEKREKLLELDIESGVPNDTDTKSETFIPVCTKNVFLKYYSTNITQLRYWGHEDRKAYLEAIKNYLKHFTN